MTLESVVDADVHVGVVVGVGPHAANAEIEIGACDTSGMLSELLSVLLSELMWVVLYTIAQVPQMVQVMPVVSRPRIDGDVCVMIRVGVVSPVDVLDDDVGPFDSMFAMRRMASV